MLDPGKVWAARVDKIRVAIDLNGFLIEASLDEPVITEDIVRLRMRLAFRRGLKGEELVPIDPPRPEPYVLVEENLSLEDGRITFYNYDLVMPSRGAHFGIHFHRPHNDAGAAHRQGSWFDPESYGPVDIDVALYDIVQTAFLFVRAT